jgi:hypothetical protein
MFDPNVMSPLNPAGSVMVFTTELRKTRFTVNGPCPLDSMTLYVTDWPKSRTELLGVNEAADGAAETVIVFEALAKAYGVYVPVSVAITL